MARHEKAAVGKRRKGRGGCASWTRLALIGLMVLGVLLGQPSPTAGQPGPVRGGHSASGNEQQAATGVSAAATSAEVVREEMPVTEAADGPDVEVGATEPDRAAGESPPVQENNRDIMGLADTTAVATDGSVRPRGEAAPIDLAAAAPVAAARARRAANSPGARVWPLPPDAFEFSQDFGCVAQIGGFYAVVEGCPNSRPAFHSGIDLAASRGTRFYAAASGWVIEAGLDREVGLANTRILIQHDGANAGYATEYFHWIVSFVEPGQYVRAGQPIGEVGSVGYSTGPHLHFGVVDFESGARIDPLRWLPRNRAAGKYLGLAPGSVRVRFNEISIELPDYADPSPPPVPTEQTVPEAAPAGESVVEAGVDEGAQDGSDPGAAEGNGNSGQNNNGDGRNSRNGRNGGDGRGEDDSDPGPSTTLPPPVPGVPVSTGSDNDDDDNNKGGKKK